MSDEGFKDYLLNDIPADLHAEMKKTAKSQKITMRMWLLKIIKEAVDGSEK